MRKLLLYVFSATLMLMFSMNAVAQQGSKVNVSSDQEMLEAIDNPNVKTIEVIVGDFYPSLGVTLGEGSIVSKGGSRGDCNYFISPQNTCFVAPNTSSFAEAGTTGGPCPTEPTSTSEGS